MRKNLNHLTTHSKRVSSAALAITQDDPCPCDDSHKDKAKEVGQEVVQSATFYIYHTHRFDVIAHRIKLGDDLCPMGHTRHWSEQSAKQKEDNQEKEHHQGCLLDGVAIVGDYESKTAHHKNEQGGHDKNGQDTARRNDAMN